MTELGDREVALLAHAGYTKEHAMCMDPVELVDLITALEFSMDDFEVPGVPGPLDPAPSIEPGQVIYDSNEDEAYNRAMAESIDEYYGTNAGTQPSHPQPAQPQPQPAKPKKRSIFPKHHKKELPVLAPSRYVPKAGKKKKQLHSKNKDGGKKHLTQKKQPTEDPPPPIYDSAEDEAYNRAIAESIEEYYNKSSTVNPKRATQPKKEIQPRKERNPYPADQTVTAAPYDEDDELLAAYIASLEDNFDPVAVDMQEMSRGIDDDLLNGSITSIRKQLTENRKKQSTRIPTAPEQPPVQHFSERVRPHNDRRQDNEHRTNTARILNEQEKEYQEALEEARRMEAEALEAATTESEDADDELVIPDEPAEGITVAVRLPTNQRVSRKFKAEDLVQYVHNWVRSNGEIAEAFELIEGTSGALDCAKSLSDNGINLNVLLHVDME